MDMVAPMLHLQTILELEGLCPATRAHSLSTSFWARVAPVVNPRVRLPDCLPTASARTVKEFTLLLLAVAAPAQGLRLESEAEVRGLMDRVRRAKRRVSESRAVHARQLTVDYCRAARGGAQLLACRLRFQDLGQRLLGARWTVALGQRSLCLEALWTGAELQVRGLCTGIPELSFALLAASPSLQLHGRATSSGAVNRTLVLAAGDVGAALLKGVLCVLLVEMQPRAAAPSTISSLQLSLSQKATEALRS